jgi:hypothetical protein
MTTTRTTRYFGKCRVAGCKTRIVAEINRNDYSREIAQHTCPGHPGTLTVAWSPLKGTVNTEKECTGRCMASKGPSCDCACGGDNHGSNHC